MLVAFWQKKNVDKRGPHLIIWPSLHFKITRNVGRLENSMYGVKYCCDKVKKIDENFLLKYVMFLNLTIVLRYTFGLLTVFESFFLGEKCCNKCVFGLYDVF